METDTTWPHETMSTGKEVAEFYDKWIRNQDDSYDLTREHYGGPKILADHLRPFLEEKLRANELNRLLDVGAGSGWLAEEIRPYVGDSVVFDSLEPSVGMSEVAKKLNLYSTYYQEFLTTLNSTTIPSETYDCACACGAFIPNHIPAEGILELLRVTKTGGVIGIVMRGSFATHNPQYKGKFLPLFAKLEAEKKIEKLDVTHDIDGYFDGMKGLVLIYKKLGN